jgi:hypothetical protein
MARGQEDFALSSTLSQRARLSSNALVWTVATVKIEKHAQAQCRAGCGFLHVLNHARALHGKLKI